MRYSSDVNICFQKSAIYATRSDISLAASEGNALINGINNAYSSAQDYISSVLKWVSDCFEQNNVDETNAHNLGIAIEQLMWDTQKELERRQATSDALYKAKSNAYNTYDSIKSKSKPDDQISARAAEAAYSRYKKLERDFNEAYKRTENCKKRIECLYSAQYDLNGIKYKIHDDRMLLYNYENEYKRLRDDLERAISKAKGKISKAVKLFEKASGCAEEAEAVAAKILYIFSELSSNGSHADAAIFRSVSSVENSACALSYEAEHLRNAQSDIIHTTDEYNDLIRDDIMPEASLLVEECSRAVENTIRVFERKASALHDLAKQLQKYCDLADRL